ncbi:hypothetical protein HaLaN_10419, partial [Haematococcus lacustris]
MEQRRALRRAHHPAPPSPAKRLCGSAPENVEAPERARASSVSIDRTYSVHSAGIWPGVPGCRTRVDMARVTCTLPNVIHVCTHGTELPGPATQEQVRCMWRILPQH